MMVRSRWCPFIAKEVGPQNFGVPPVGASHHRPGNIRGTSRVGEGPYSTAARSGADTPDLLAQYLVSDMAPS
jgi:hypothetical protein